MVSLGLNLGRVYNWFQMLLQGSLTVLFQGIHNWHWEEIQCMCLTLEGLLGFTQSQDTHYLRTPFTWLVTFQAWALTGTSSAVESIFLTAVFICCLAFSTSSFLWVFSIISPMNSFQFFKCEKKSLNLLLRNLLCHEKGRSLIISLFCNLEVKLADSFLSSRKHRASADERGGYQCFLTLRLQLGTVLPGLIWSDGGKHCGLQFPSVPT